MTSLLEQKFIPICRRSGQRDWIAPTQVADPDIVALAANRADFNGALAQFLIGLLQSTAPVQDEKAWKTYLESPPDAALLTQWFAPVAEYFALDGDGPRFMQDFDMGEADGAVSGVDALLIDAPGASSIDKNIDHFVKRNTVTAMCPDCVATALLTLQVNAPAGGAGHRTSLRGGGPLTTLVVESPTQSLWRNLWMNVRPLDEFLDQASCGDPQRADAHFKFPWLASTTAIQKAGTDTQPAQVHPFHVYWAMPRRIRLNFSKTQAGHCDICGRHSERLVSEYVTKPQGLNYKGNWLHPLSPYYENKGDWLPVHPQPGGFSYRHWLAWVYGSDDGKKKIRPATLVHVAISDRRKFHGRQKPSLWVFGYDMDNMKARCWYETVFPLYDLNALDRDATREVLGIVAKRIEASEQAAFYLRQAVRQALFGEGEARGDFGHVDQMFWDATTQPFFVQLESLFRQVHEAGHLDADDTEQTQRLGMAWRDVLCREALRLFDRDLVGAAPISQVEPRRVSEAHHQLQRNLRGKAINAMLRIVKPEPVPRENKKSRTTQPTTQSTLDL